MLKRVEHRVIECGRNLFYQWALVGAEFGPRSHTNFGEQYLLQQSRALWQWFYGLFRIACACGEGECVRGMAAC